MAIMQKAQGQQAGPPAAPPPQASGTAMPPGASEAPPAEQGYDDNDGLPEEEQDRQLDSFLDNAYQIIYGGQTPEGQINPDIAESLRAGAGGDQETGQHGAIEALAGTAASVGAAVTSSAVENGIQLDGPGVVLPGTLSLVEDLADVAVREGIYDYSEDELASAATRAGELLFERTADLGLWKEEEFDAAVQETLRLNQSGELEAMMPETAGAMAQVAGPTQGGEGPPPAAAPPAGA